MTEQTFRAIRVTEHVYWVGAIDWAVRDFHGYTTPRGSTYNAFLVLAEKVTLIDTVKPPFKNELLSRIASVIDPQSIDYIVSNHSEMDHSGCLPDVIEVTKPEKVFASKMGVRALKSHFRGIGEITAVADGETISLGNMSLIFAESRMLHWPDSMVSFLPEEKILFSQDAFGMHLATSERFADEIDPSILEYEGAKYYANILLPYSKLIPKFAEKLMKLGTPGETIRIIAPDHGPIWRNDLNTIISWYGKWAAQEPTNKAIVVYDTMWNSTAKMARAIEEGLEAEGTSVKVLPLNSCDRSMIATEVLGAGALVVGSPTLNNALFPTVSDVMCYLKGLRPANLIGAAFGSYGWSGESVKLLNEILTEMKVDLVSEGVRALYVPDETALAECRALGRAVAEKLRQRVGQ